MPDAKHSVRQELHGIIAFLAAIWGVFLVSRVFPSLDRFGIVPRTLVGLIGILSAPFLHADWNHIVSNTFPLLILLALLAGSKARSWEIVIEIVFLGGSLLWLFGRDGDHIGASGLIFGLIAFLLVSGFLEKRFVPLAVSLVVLFFYGGTLLSGVLPRIGSSISWDGHLYSALAGGMIAYALTRSSESPAKPPVQP